ncbi:hypothetical protein AGMMS50293_29800 [Spirochaetia bacterium]|nr:hypothetical protein AGMMS50293_29800 [Spirochaetia bacterium]
MAGGSSFRPFFTLNRKRQKRLTIQKITSRGKLRKINFIGGKDEEVQRRRKSNVAGGLEGEWEKLVNVNFTHPIKIMGGT